MQLDTIKLFCDVAENRSVSRAAELSGITQSAASQRIMALERELGVQLVDRSTRPLQLTDTGRRYHHGCRKIIDRYRLLEQQIKASGRNGRGVVHVAAIYSAGIDLLNQIQHDFEAEHNDVTVEIHYAQPDQVHEQVKAGRVDMGILSYPDRWRGVVTHPLREETMVVVAGADHPLMGRDVLKPGDLDRQDMVMFDSKLPISRRIAEYMRRHHVSPNVVQVFDNIDTIKGYLAETGVAAILPNRTVRQEINRGALAAAALEPTIVRPLALVRSRQKELSALAQSFMSYLLENQPSPEAGSPTKATTATA